MIKFSSVCLGLLLLQGSAFSQVTLNGKVVDATTNAPLEGAIVTFENTQLPVFTTAEGGFTFKTKNQSVMIFNISLLGYTTKSDTLELLRDTSITISLQPAPFIQDEVIISSTRANEKSGIAYTNLSKKEIEAENNGRDIPYLLQSTPSLVATSDAGTGIGYTGVRIRGSDATRINFTLNGIPMNDAESQQLYWVDLPDLASSTDNIQVQRGVGTSTNGAGAFGGSINMLSSSPPEKPYATTINGYGTFNTLKNNISAGTGLINGHWNVEGRVSRISSDGYIDRATSDLKSGFLTAGYYGKKDLFKANIITGKEITYQSWLGVPEYSLDTNRTLNLYTYENQVDNYQQDHYQFFWAHDASGGFTINTALHYTKGRGYYEEYKADQMLADYNLSPVIAGSDTITMSDLVRRKWLDNDFYGATWSLQYDKRERMNLIFGGAINRYDGDHFGNVIWAEFASDGQPNHEYYRNESVKTDMNMFLKGGFDFGKRLHLYGDLQVRSVDYDFIGLDDDGSTLPQNDQLTFFNPKAGISYAITEKSQGYLSFGIANKEPSRSDYVDNPKSSQPDPETLYDLEAGFRHASEKLSAGVNFYYMNYKDQLAVTGRLNDVGDPIRVNIPESHRAGIELDATFIPAEKIELKGNITFSENKINEYSETIYNYDNGEVSEQKYNNTDLAYSPELTAGLTAGYRITKSLRVNATGRYVGQQFLDNTSTSSRSLDPYFVTYLRLDYTLKPKFMKELTLSFWANNVFDELYESNGYTYSYIYGGELLTENFYYPQAGINMMAQLTLKF